MPPGEAAEGGAHTLAQRLEGLEAGRPARGVDAGEAQPRPDLAMALAVEGTHSEQLADRLDQRLVRHRSDRTRPSPGTRLLASAMSIQRRARRAPEPGHPQDAVGSAGGGRGPAAHGLDLPRAKGRPASRCSILVASSSLAMVRSPTLALRRPISASRPSAGRVFNDASPAARKASRPALSSAAGTESSRDNSSRSSPRNSRNTALCLRLADMRRRLSGAGPSPPA